MTVSSAVSRSGPYTFNGATTVFDYDFKIFDEDHLRVVVEVDGVETDLAIGTDYTVSGVGSAGGGQVTTLEAYDAPGTLTIVPNVPFTQEIDLENQGAYYAETVERGLDLSVARDLQLAEGLERAVKVPTHVDPENLPQLVEDITALAALVRDIGLPAILKYSTGALPLAAFGAFTGTSHVAAIQSGFDAAIGEGRPLVGFYPDGGYFKCDAPLILRSGLKLDFTGIPATFRRLYTTGSWIEGLFTTPNWSTLDGGAALEDIQEDIELLGVRFDDDGNTRRGSFLAMKCDRLKIRGLRGVKLSAGWTTQFMGIDIDIDDVYLNSYDASDDDLPDGTQVWSDTLHFSFCPGLKLNNVRAYAQDDCIAFTLDPAAWATMLPKRDPVSRNINVGGGLVLRSKTANPIRIGCEPIYGAGAAPCDADVAYDNITVDGIAAYCPIDDHVRTAPIVVLEDDRDNATQRHGLITIRSVTGRADVDTGGTSVVQIIGQKSGETADRNFDTVVLDGIAVTNSAASTGRKIAATGVRKLVLRNIDLDEETPSTIPAATGLLTEYCDDITLDNVRLKHRSTIGAAAFLHYDSLRISDSSFSGGVADAGTDEFDGIYLVPNTDARISLRGVQIRDTARALRETGTHGFVQVDDLDLVNVAFPTLPAEFDLAVKKSKNPVLGFALCTTTPTIASGFNATSVAKNGTGDYTITWSTTLPNSVYPISVSPGTVGLIAYIIGKTTTTTRVGFKDAAGTATDPTGEFGVTAYGFL